MNRKILALLALLVVFCPSVLAEQDGDVTIKRNPDGTIETYDTSDGPAPSGGGHSQGARPVHSYTKKTSDGIHFKRNPDGSIETWEDDEPMPRAHGGGGGTSKAKKKSVAKKAVDSKVTIKKKTK